MDADDLTEPTLSCEPSLSGTPPAGRMVTSEVKGVSAALTPGSTMTKCKITRAVFVQLDLLQLWLRKVLGYADTSGIGSVVWVEREAEGRKLGGSR